MVLSTALRLADSQLWDLLLPNFRHLLFLTLGWPVLCDHKLNPR